MFQAHLVPIVVFYLSIFARITNGYTIQTRTILDDLVKTLPPEQTGLEVYVVDRDPFENLKCAMNETANSFSELIPSYGYQPCCTTAKRAIIYIIDARELDIAVSILRLKMDAVIVLVAVGSSRSNVVENFSNSDNLFVYFVNMLPASTSNATRQSLPIHREDLKEARLTPPSVQTMTHSTKRSEFSKKIARRWCR